MERSPFYMRALLKGLLIASLATGCYASAQQAGDSLPKTPPPIHYEKFSTPSGNGFVHLVVFDLSRYTLRVIDNGAQATQPKFGSLADAAQRFGGMAGINGGFFDPEKFTPAGLLISGGRTVSTFDPEGWQEGVLAIQKNGIFLIERDAFHQQSDITDALQSSPWLVRSGQVTPALKGDSSRARRVFVAKSKSGLCAIGLATPTTFYDLAEFLLSEPVAKSIPISDALALDGASSAGFWCEVDGQRVNDPEIVTVRDFVVVVPADAQAQDQDPSTFNVHTGAFHVSVTDALLAVILVGGWLMLRRKSAKKRMKKPPPTCSL